jgi:RNA polymerase-binding transcription factor DksA
MMMAHQAQRLGKEREGTLADQANKLREERERTEAELRRQRGYLATELGHVSDGSADSVDTAAEIYEREKTLAIIQTLQKKLASIEHALRATEKGSYGICEICGEAIDPGRLEVMPHTMTCIKCQARLERLQPPRSLTNVTREEE